MTFPKSDIHFSTQYSLTQGLLQSPMHQARHRVMISHENQDRDSDSMASTPRELDVERPLAAETDFSTTNSDIANMRRGSDDPLSCSPGPQQIAWPDSRKRLIIAAGLVFGLAAAYLPIGFGAGNEAAQKCLGILLCAACWWIFEPFPPYVTALFVAFFIVIGKVMRVPDLTSAALIPAKESPVPGGEVSTGDPLSATATAQVVAEAFFDPVIFLFVSGFAMGAALDKFRITERLSKQVLEGAAANQSSLLLVVIGLCCSLSSALSNVAAAVLVTAVISPIAKRAHRNSSPGFAKQAILSAAYGCNVGGMMTPIASPQNVIAIVALRTNAGIQMDFLEWCAFSFPFCAAAAVLVWVVVRLMFRDSGLSGRPMESPQGSSDPLSSSDVFICAVVGVTVFLWCIFDSIQPVFGHIGVVALLPVLIFHSCGVLQTSDWQKMSWSVLTLLGGGVALGNAVESSGLLGLIASKISESLKGSSTWLSACAFFFTICVVANFLSSTVCAIITLPVVAKVGASLGHPKMFVVGCAVMTSAAMGLPISSFPNANAASVLREGKPIVENKDFIRSGFLLAGLLLVLMSSFGMVLFYSMGW